MKQITITMSKQMKKMLLITGGIFGLIFSWYFIKKLFFLFFMLTYHPAPVTVEAVTAAPTVWRSYLSSVGTLTAVNGVDISAQTSGIVKEIRFTSGQFVKAGDVLVLLDTSVEQAQLKDNQAKLKLAQLNYERNQKLIKKNAVAVSVNDSSFAELQQAEAGVEGSLARIKEKTILAPFDGKIGIRLIDLGGFVSPGTPIVTLQSLDPLLVQFTLPEQNVPLIFLGQPVEVSLDLDSKNVTVQGEITAINSKVDPNTRNILVQARLPNKELQLYPGMFCTVKIWLREQNNVIALPQTAISYSLHGDSIYVIKDESKGHHKKPVLKAYRQYVKTGERRDDLVRILSGLNPNDRVVTSGQLKLQNGTPVVIDNHTGV